MITRQIVIPGWRGRTTIDACERLPNGRGTERQITESYVDLIESRGHSLPKTETGWKHAGPAAGVRSELYRNSRDSEHYFNGGWFQKRPDIFQRYGPGLWGIREEVHEQIKLLKFDGHSLLAAEVYHQQPGLPPNILLNDIFVESEEQKVYFFENLIPGRESGQKILKIGRSYKPTQRPNGLMTGNPYPIVPRIIIEGLQADVVENKLQTLLKANRINREWYMISINDDLETLGKAFKILLGF